ncbi:MAG TPA: hypothetical protein VKP60_10105, partial [Magnetospirillaceae bacterium]|nr:hypothetical protein [Magnetospirillaceae bacterium]
MIVRAFFLAALVAAGAQASDHLDTPSVIANPSADIGDLYGWMSPDGKSLNLVMDIVGRSFSDRLDYVFHIDSGPRFGETPASLTITCRFPDGVSPDCGDKAHIRVFAGPRDDPFFNNVKGTREAYKVASDALEAGAPLDKAGCPVLPAKAISEQFRHTDGGPATNFLKGWPTSAIVISIDIETAAKGGPVLALWSATATRDKQIDRLGRPMTKNALLGLFGPEDQTFALREEYNLATPVTAQPFIPQIERGLALYDGFDGKCGNQLMAGPPGPGRYHRLAALLADDRLWVDSRAKSCHRFMAVERGIPGDCGGRPPSMNAANSW